MAGLERADGAAAVPDPATAMFDDDMGQRMWVPGSVSWALQTTGQSLQKGTRSQKGAIEPIEQRQSQAPAKGKAERAKKRDRPPDGGKGFGAVQHASILDGMETGKQLALVERAGRRLGLIEIDEADRAAAIEAAHQRDLPLA